MLVILFHFASMAVLVMGVKIVKNDIKKRLDNIKLTSGGGIPPSVFQQIEIQWRKENNKRFTKQKYADENGNIDNWKDFNPKTLLGNRKRPSGAKYTAQSILLQDTGRLKNSLLSGQHADSISLIKDKSIEIGSKVVYAIIHHKGKGRIPQRPVLTISKEDRKKFERIIIKYLKGEWK